MTFDQLIDFANRYHLLTDDMRKALPMVAAGSRDGAETILGPYGHKWDVVESLLSDAHDAGVLVPACLGRTIDDK
jgi:hypothetical protein